MSLTIHSIYLICYRSHALRNYHELCEIIVDEPVNRDPSYFREWRSLAIGEGDATIISTSRIERLGRLSLEEYGRLMSQSAVGHLKRQPHPLFSSLLDRVEVVR
jgi:hypothetical protein